MVRVVPAFAWLLVVARLLVVAWLDAWLLMPARVVVRWLNDASREV